jgi:hypothetical protein
MLIASRQRAQQFVGRCPTPNLDHFIGGSSDRVERFTGCIHGYLSMFFKASLRATSGVTPPFVAISKAALIEVQNLPI